MKYILLILNIWSNDPQARPYQVDDHYYNKETCQQARDSFIDQIKSQGGRQNGWNGYPIWGYVCIPKGQG